MLFLQDGSPFCQRIKNEYSLQSSNKLVSCSILQWDIVTELKNFVSADGSIGSFHPRTAGGDVAAPRAGQQAHTERGRPKKIDNVSKEKCIELMVTVLTEGYVSLDSAMAMLGLTFARCERRRQAICDLFQGWLNPNFNVNGDGHTPNYVVVLSCGDEQWNAAYHAAILHQVTFRRVSAAAAAEANTATADAETAAMEIILATLSDDNRSLLHKYARTRAEKLAKKVVPCRQIAGAFRCCDQYPQPTAAAVQHPRLYQHQQCVIKHAICARL
jgi:hypothetical protein